MQAVYSTTTDVKIHTAIRREWVSFQTWLFEQHRRLEYRENEILSAAQRKRGKMKQADTKKQIVALQEEFLAVGRSEWLARVRHSQLHLEHWVMTPDEKQVLQMTLGWTQKDMVDAYAREQAEMGAMYQRVDPTTLGTKEPAPLQSTSRFMHPPVNETVPAYAKWASELAKIPAPGPSSRKAPKPKSLKSVELPALPLYFVGALLQGTDMDAVVASDLEAFALHVSEEKIREYYAEACAATLHFQRHLATLDPSQRKAAQEGFEHHMRDLASGKEREWKALTVKELRRHQAAEMEKRVAQQRAMRPSPPRRDKRREFRDWDYVDDYDSYSSYASPPPQDYSAYTSPQPDYFQEYRSPRREYRETYQSPLLSSVETYRSPRRVRRRPVPEEEYVRGGIRLFSTDRVRTAPSKPTTAARDWSSVRVDEVDLKSRVINASKKRASGHGNDFLLRLEGTTNSPTRGKLKKRKSENKKGEQAPGKIPAAVSGSRMGGAGRVFGRGVPHPEKQIPVARETVVGPAQADKKKSQPDAHRYRMGGSGFGLGNSVPYKSTVNAGQTRDGAGPERRLPRRQSNLDRILKRVRFTPSALAVGVASNPKRSAMARKLNVNETQSRFYEGFGSKANCAAS